MRFKGLEKVAAESKTATGRKPLELYINFRTREVTTTKTSGSLPVGTSLIRECTPDEIEKTVLWALSM